MSGDDHVNILHLRDSMTNRSPMQSWLVANKGLSNNYINDDWTILVPVRCFTVSIVVLNRTSKVNKSTQQVKMSKGLKCCTTCCVLLFDFTCYI